MIDIAGRVLGVLVPMSPDGGEEVAGVEWYDSGIGFAIPLESVLASLDAMKQGRDLHAGLLGVNLKTPDLYGPPALLAAVRAGGPAYKAGFRAGDTIIEAAGQPVTRGAQLKHALGRHYAGDTVQIVALRGDQRIDRQVELAETIEPYEFPFVGLLAMRPPTDAEPESPTLRYVYPDSPAAVAGLKAGDRLTTFEGKPVKTYDEVLEQMATLAPGETVKLELRRGDETLSVECKLGKLPETIPPELPPAHEPLAAEADAARPATGVIAIKVPEFANECLAYVPESYDPRQPHGVVVWLHAPGGFKSDELVELWKPLCEQHDFILLAPKGADKARWQPTEARFVRRALEELQKNYTTDPARVVIHGHQGGGAMAYLVGLLNPDVFRAIAAVDAPLPRLAQVPASDPTHRLAFYTTLASKSENAAAVEATIKKLREAKYPVTVVEIGEQARYLTAEEMAELVRWFDALDRL